VKPLRPWAKVAIVLLGFGLAWAVGLVVCAVCDHYSKVPEVEKAGGMYGFGQLLLFLAVSGVVAVIPLALGLIWLRPIARFWRLLTGVAFLLALSGVVALVANLADGSAQNLWMLAAQVRIGLMPLTALALLACGIIAPLPRHRWVLIGAAVCDGVIFAGVILVHFVLPGLNR
jgi:hypothetical protein